MAASIFSVDVEEWFHILETDAVSTHHADWDKYPVRIEAVFDELLRLLEKNNARATMFFLGWIAEKYPHLVRRAQAEGHEIAVHGYYHELVYNQTYDAFYNEVYRTKALLEDITGQAVVGFRAPGFSLTKDSVWAYRALMEAGYQYSSSVYPAPRAHGSYSSFGMQPKRVEYQGRSIVEFPMTILKAPITALSCFGGGYFRLFPLFWYERAASAVQRERRPLIFYIHPRDIDREQPRVRLPLSRRIKCYVNVDSAGRKIDRMLQSRPYTTFKDVLQGMDVHKLPVASLQVPSGYRSAYLAH
jgi:polysaccharide deacetylase family protein (PEP-CTERM system associated)